MFVESVGVCKHVCVVAQCCSVYQIVQCECVCDGMQWLCQCVCGVYVSCDCECMCDMWCVCKCGIAVVHCNCMG